MAVNPSSLKRKTNIHGLYADLKRFNENTEPGDGGCINWIGPKHRQGYGMVCVHSDHEDPPVRMMTTAHKLAATKKFGRQISSDECVIHTCGNMACVNPDHLILGDRKDIMAVMVKNGHSNEGKTFTVDRRKNMEYTYTIPECYWILDHQDDRSAVMKHFNLDTGNANIWIDRVKNYRWLHHFDRKGNLKKEFAQLYEKKNPYTK